MQVEEASGLEMTCLQGRLGRCMGLGFGEFGGHGVEGYFCREYPCKRVSTLDSILYEFVVDVKKPMAYTY